MDATVAGGVGAVANHFFFYLIVVQDGGRTHRQGGTQLWGGRGRREEGRKGSRERGEGGGGRGEEEGEGGKVIIIDTNKATLMLVVQLTVDRWTVECGPTATLAGFLSSYGEDTT